MDQDPTRDWQELCEAASKEPDPKKLMSLITEIVKALDDRRRKTAGVASVQNFEGSSSAGQHSVGRPQGLACENSSSTLMC
jgi:hypothetical protein